MQILRRFFLPFFCFSLVACFPPAWIRELPAQKQSLPDAVLSGTFRKNIPGMSPLTSLGYIENHSEFIEFSDVEKTFRKTYNREIEEGNKFRQMRVEGKGRFKTKGNWVLLMTESLIIEESVWEKGKKPETSGAKTSRSNHRLLYHYDPNSLSLIPMLYETGYKEKPFGVVEGIRVPYSEDEAFRIARKNFAKKEYQTHAYYKIR
ncbi:hypothetical protein EHO60_00400 [Leptospira fletcheri]|uniref:Lipoprotein n=1 Tax=Leptospira fletcheri TaxID=2484981 RepID=A0A4R9GJF8_9LEPT|nr:hypothetical protein [Leptospira fletcheri]TGK13852.1 hypothetical protein EHO60_00400 [Leptospira fletcheri]